MNTRLAQAEKVTCNLVRKGMSNRTFLHLSSKISVEKFFQRLILRHLYSMEKKKSYEMNTVHCLKAIIISARMDGRKGDCLIRKANMSPL